MVLIVQVLLSDRFLPYLLTLLHRLVVEMPHFLLLLETWPAGYVYCFSCSVLRAVVVAVVVAVAIAIVWNLVDLVPLVLVR